MARRGEVDTRDQHGSALAAAAALATLVAACVGDEQLSPMAEEPATTTTTTTTSAGGGLAWDPDGGGDDAEVDVRWAHRWGGKSTDERVAGVVAEPDGAVVVASTLGAFDGVEPALVAADEDDVLLVRYGAQGDVLGTRVLGSFGHDAPRFLARRNDGSLIVTGVFGTVLDEVEPNLVAYGGLATFAMAITPDLAPRWGVAILGADVGRGQIASAVTDDGGVVLAGTWSAVVSIADVVAVNGGETDGYIARFTEDGRLAWIRLLDGDDVAHLEIGAAVGTSGDQVVIAAQLRGTLAVDGATIAESAGANRPVLLRVDRDGAVVRATTLRGTGSASIGRMVRDGEGLVATVALGGTLELPDGVLRAAGEGDATLVWIDADDRASRGRSWGDRRAQGITSLDRAPDGRLLAAGSFQGALDFGLGAHKAPDGRPDAFVVELSPDGRPLRSFQIGDPQRAEDERTGSQGASGAAWLDDGGLVVGGSFTGSLRIGAVVLEARGDLDGWIARVAPR